MPRKHIDLTGQKFGRLQVLECIGNENGHYLWLCQCDCGNTKTVKTGNLNHNHVKSCGCLAKERLINNNMAFKLPLGEASFNALYRSYKSIAEKRGYDFNLSKLEFKSLTQCKCYYCGVEPNQIYKSVNKSGSYIYNGVDRIDNLQGYHTKNCVPCCGDCNRMKRDLSLQDFLLKIKSIIRRFDEHIFME